MSDISVGIFVPFTFLVLLALFTPRDVLRLFRGVCLPFTFGYAYNFPYSVFNVLSESVIKYFGAMLPSLEGSGKASALARKKQSHQERWSEEYRRESIPRQAAEAVVS